MKIPLNYVISALTLSSTLAKAQLLSCSTYTTVVFGDPHSILSSLSMVSNMTEAASSTLTSIPATFPASSSSKNSLVTTSSSSAAPSLFRITVNISGGGKLRARAIQYVAFDDSNGVLVSDPTQATLFLLDNSYLKTNTGLYVGASTNEGVSQFEASINPPAVAQGWTFDVDGGLSLPGISNVCYMPDNSLYIAFDSQPSTCTTASLSAVSASAESSSSVSSQSVMPSNEVETTAMSSSAPQPLTTSPFASTATFEGSSQEVSLASQQSLGSESVALPLSTSIIQTSASNTITSGSDTDSSTTSSWISVSGTNGLGSSTRTNTSPSAVLTSISTTSTSTSSAKPATSSGSSSVITVESMLTSIVGPGQLSTKISSIFSLRFSVSSVTVSTGSTTSTLPPSASSTVSSSSSSLMLSAGNTIPSTPVSSSTSLVNTSTTTFLGSSSISFTSASSSISSLAPLPSPYARNTGKRGLVYTNVSNTQYYSLQGQNSLVSWAYDYASYPNASNNAGPVNPALTFIPLLFNDAPGATSIWSANVNYSLTHYNTDALFSFNEPDVCYSSQSACMSVNQSVNAYRSYMQPFAGRGVALGAPAITNGGPPASLTYLSSFLGNCTGCTVDFINLHWYASPYSFAYLQAYVQQAYQVGGGRPVYLSELGMDSVYYAEAAVQAFLKNATTWLDAQPYVWRYSWFGDFAQTGPVGVQQGFGYLVNNASTALSAEGVIWNNYTGGYAPCPGTSC